MGINTNEGEKMEYTGKWQMIEYEGKTLRLCNQSCPEWTHMYNYPSIPREAEDDLHLAGCGIFSVIHLIDWLTGEKASPDELADFSMATGGRGDDGTDRPVLLKAMEEAGRLKKIGVHYAGDGLLNDHEALWANLKAGGVALTNLRDGHIVAVVDCREVNAERQILIMDSARDSMHPQVRGNICEVIPQSKVCARYINRRGVETQEGYHYGMFWVTLEQAEDFNLLRKL